MKRMSKFKLNFYDADEFLKQLQSDKEDIKEVRIDKYFQDMTNIHHHASL